MSMPPVFDKYFTREDANYYYRLFSSNGLYPVIDRPKESFDAIFGNTQVDLQYVLRLPAADFEKASALLEREIRRQQLPEDYYLHELDNQALYDMLLHPKDWSRQDVIAAKIILEDRYFEIKDDQLALDKAQRKEKEKEKQKISLPVLILLYLVSPLAAFLPVVAGIIIYVLKDTDVDGKIDFVFSNNYRQHGLVLAVIGILSSLAWYFAFS
jgi:uncharacterized membrane protein